MNIDTNLTIRHYFDDLYHAQKHDAKCLAFSCIELLNFQDLDPSQRVLKIIQELDLHQKKMDGFVRKEYLNFADDEPHLFNYFSGHLYFCRHHEEEKLLESLVLSETHHLLSQLLQEAMAQLPLFTFADFMNNNKNVVFYELNQQPFGTSYEEYTTMRCWQSQMKLECVNQESNHLIARFIERVSVIPGNRNLAQAEKDQVAFLLGNAPKISTEEFITKFSNLRTFSADSMPENATEWHESFCQFVKGNAMPHALSPCSLQLAFNNIQAGKISNAPICGWSLMKYKKWLGDVLEGKIDFKELPELSYEKLFEKKLKVGPLKSKETISEFNKKIDQRP